MAQIEGGKLVTVRATQPGSYMFKIHSFSSITESDMFKYFESPEFESCGYKWKLSVYPFGDEKQGVRDHISLYLVSTEANDESDSFEVNAAFKLFVYDHFLDNFLTVQFQDSGARRFRGVKKEWGFTPLISHVKFKDTENGYLVNDCCIFGVEILVIPNLVRMECLQLIKSDGIFTWILSMFSTWDKLVCYSEFFHAQGHQWRLMIYPNGFQSGKGTHLSVFLEHHKFHCHGSPIVNVKVVLKLRNHLNDKHYEKTFTCCFDGSIEDCGFSEYCLLKDLKDKSKGFIVDNCMTFEVEIKRN